MDRKRNLVAACARRSPEGIVLHVFQLALLLSVLALAAGFGLAAVGRDRPRLRLVVEGFMLGVVPTLIFGRIVPRLWNRVDVLGLSLMATGYATVWLLERSAERTKIQSPVIVAALGVHSLIDGASLAVAERLQLGKASALLVGALVMHRVPEGLVAGALLIPRRGLKFAAAGTGVLAAMMLAGAMASREVFQHVDGPSLAALVAFGMGALLCAVLHGHARLRERPALVSALLGAALALAVPETS